MRFWPLVWKNATRNVRRTVLTLLSVAVSLALLTLLLTVEDAMQATMETSGRSLRVSVRHTTSFAILLPIAYRTKIEAVPGVLAVSPFSWYGGNYRDPREIMPSVACDAHALQHVWGDRLETTEAEWKRFRGDRMGALTTALQASRYGWKSGDMVTLKGRAVPVDLTFHISGILTKTFDPLIFLFHWNYLDSVLGNRGDVGNYWLKVDRVENIPRVIRTINETFANAPQPVVAETEKGFVEMLLGMMRMIRLVVLAVGSAVVVSIMLVTANTIAMSVRERIVELGVLRAIGFKQRHILAFVLGESCLISFVGGGCGSALAWAGCHYSATIVPGGPAAALLSMARPSLILVGLAVSIVVGLAGGIVPALGAVRIPVHQALRQVV